MSETLIQMLESECISMVLSEYYHTKIGRMHMMKHKATALEAERDELKAKLEAMERALATANAMLKNYEALAAVQEQEE